MPGLTPLNEPPGPVATATAWGPYQVSKFNALLPCQICVQAVTSMHAMAYASASQHFSWQFVVRGVQEKAETHSTRLPSDCTMRKTPLPVEFSLTPCSVYNNHPQQSHLLVGQALCQSCCVDTTVQHRDSALKSSLLMGY